MHFRDIPVSNWASSSLADRSLAYNTMRLAGSSLILGVLLLVSRIRPNYRVSQTIFLTVLDLTAILLHRWLLYRGRFLIAGTWMLQASAIIITTIGIHLGGGVISLTTEIYIIVILASALVFLKRRWTYLTAIICLTLYLGLAYLEFFGPLRDSLNIHLRPIYTWEQLRVSGTNIALNVILIWISTFLVGKAGERLGHWGMKLETEVARRTEENRRLYEEREASYLQILHTLANVIATRDPYTKRHSQRLVILGEKLARAMGLSAEEIDLLRWASLLHDIGKIGVPDAILRKPGPLTPREWKVMKQHPVFGANIIAPLSGMERVAAIIRAHHERFDGSGYPDGLAGRRIPLLSRILTVVDAYVAMTDERAYSPSYSREKAIRELLDNRGTQFDPRIVDVFIRILEEEGDNGVSDA